MPPQLTQDQREQITAALFRREDAKEIADANGISERQVRRIAQNLKQYGTVTAPRLKKMGRPTCLNKEVEDDLRNFVSAQPLALLEDMQVHIQKTFGVKCSRASLSRRMREMGFTRGIIRRGFRSSDPSVPALSQIDMERLTGAPSPNDELVGLNGNAKKAKYAWLLHGEPAGTRKPRKKKLLLHQQHQQYQQHQQHQQHQQQLDDVQLDDSMIQPGLDDAQIDGMEHHNGHEQEHDHANEHHIMASQYPIPVGQQQMPSTISHDGYVASYVSPYRQVTADDGMMVRHAGEHPPHMGSMMGGPPPQTLSMIRGSLSMN